MSTALQIVPAESLATALRENKLGDFTATSPTAACLMPLLEALRWRGTRRDVAEALPHFSNSLDLMDLRNILVTLGFESYREAVSLDKLDKRLLPCLYVQSDGATYVIKSFEDDTFQIFDGEKNEADEVPIQRTEGNAYFFSMTDTEESAAAEVSRGTWFSQLVRRFRKTLYSLLILTFALNLVALCVPLFIMVVYDKVIGAHSPETLPSLAAGILIALMAEIGIRLVRSRVIGGVAGRLDYILGAEAFKQIMSLPPAATERSTVGSQISRLKEFESIREFFTGPLVTVGLELPFVFMFLAVIAALGGLIALIPVFMIVAFMVLGWLLLPRVRDAVATAGRARMERQNFLVETLGNLRIVKGSAAEPIWRDRFRALSATAVTTNYEMSKRSILLQTTAQLLMTLSGAAVLGYGTLQVLAGSMTVGALIATMALVWRVLSPLQAGFLAFSRLEQVKQSIQHINQLMQLRPESQAGRSSLMGRSFGGRVAFERVSFRYAADGDPALLGVAFDVQPGEMVAIMGQSGAGKSTLLKMAAGLYYPQAGAVTIDGLDLRQIDPMEIRRAIAYVPQTSSLFYGTISQNLRLSVPTASDEEIAQAAAEAGVLHSILDLPEGFDTRIGNRTRNQFPFGFAQRLIIARALLRRSPIMLMDEPAANLDEGGDQVLMELLERIKGRSTILMVSHRPSHIRIADKAVLMDQGLVQFVGDPEEAISAIQGATL